MRRLILIVTLAAILAIGLVGGATAAAPSANCTGQFASTYGGPEFGPFVAQAAQDFHALGSSLGQGAVGPASSANACELFYPIPPF
jgi:hypothetical protein